MGIPVASAAAIVVDLDGFKDVNDQLGHTTGDRVLIAAARAMLETARARNSELYRLGGDEFICVTSLSEAHAQQLAVDLISAVEGSLAGVEGVHGLSVSASAGVARGIVPVGAGETAVSTLVSLAGHAMRSAKQSGKGRVVVHDSDLARQQFRASRVEARLRQLLGSGGCVDIHYQPLMSLPQGRVVGGFEALARWKDDELGHVSPVEFIEAAERTGLIQILGERIMGQALASLASTDFFDRGLHLAVNVSPIQLRQPDFADRTLHRLRSLQVLPSLLVLEVTESVSVAPDDAALASLRQLADAGVGLAIDDFGSGYASIGYLQRLPISGLKLDRSLSADSTPRTDSIVKAVVELARGMNLHAVLEGIETAEQEARARRLKIGFTQGWHYSKAVPLEAINPLIDRLESAHLPT